MGQSYGILPVPTTPLFKSIEATTPELGPVGFWSPKSSSFSGSDSIVRPSIKKSGAPNFFVQLDKVDDSNFVATLKHAAVP